MNYKYEYELCDEFIKNNSNEWDIYPETYSFDIYMFHKKSMIQVGIQAKLRQNIHVINQALHSIYMNNGKLKKYGPHYIAVLVPVYSYDLIYKKLNILTLSADSSITPSLIHFNSITVNEHQYRHGIPLVKLQSKAGVPSPKNLSKWRIGALKLMIKYNEQGYILSSDARMEGINPSNLDHYFEYKYLEPKIGRCFKMKLRDPKKHPAVGYEKELEDLRVYYE